MEERKGNSWLKRILDFVNPLRDPSLMVAAVLTFIEEAGNRDPWYMIVILALVNWLAVRGIVWLVVNFTFASTFLVRRFWWAMKHPRLAWRILDAVGHEEIVIGGLPSEGVLLQDGTAIMGPMLGASGIQVIGELPAGTEIPMLGLPNPNGQMGQFTTDGQNMHTPGFFPGAGSFANVNGFGNQGMGNNNYISTQSTDGLPRSFPQRSSEEEERLRQQLATYSRLLDDWIQFTEEKWRTISDGQLGWKPLRGRWSDWDDIFQDVYAAKTSDPMAEAAQAAGAATSRRFDSSREKGSAASAVACFMRDMMTLRQGLDILQGSTNAGDEASSTNAQQQQSPGSPLNRSFGGMNSGNLGSGNLGSSTTGSFSPRSTLIRRPAQIFVDADSEK
ncbi:hypothetical protein KSC_081030 [Ktedonobacter sp. SOSP1-52]|uniref:hypothetical protein n=1 Tax=Ktedonobacter sp. SOSP1-52 TaxID=2778366 RepID=UPI001916623A|nr:hypothetical protein [Ktedonobacter sp. SOSP1-52]GHO69211.1 hypothetical protein KSC_081030 [Ktedonobacter sp. SOSP1-52]